MVDNEKCYTIGYLLRTIQDYENHFAQIEKETLSIVFGVECFHEYLYGHRFTEINDHKQLKPIFNRIISCPAVQKFFLCLQNYDFQLQYLPNKDILVSDTLCGFHLSYSKPEFTKNSLIHHVHFVLSNFPISETYLKHFLLETKISMPFCKLLSLTQPMNGQKSTSYPQIHIYIIPAEVILLSVKVSV